MTRSLSGADVAHRIRTECPNAVVGYDESDIWVTPESILDTTRVLKESEDLDFAFLTAITAVDYIEYFELVYQLLSMKFNWNVVVKTKLFDRDNPTVNSVVELWKGAELQEREIWDLMGIHFEGHPNMKRILLWEGFDGHPLRKDYLG